MEAHLVIGLATPLLATEAADRLAVESAIRSLNRIPRPENVFAADAYSELGNLPAVRPKSVQMFAAQMSGETPHVRISHEVWGEAEIVYPAPSYQIFVTNPEIVCGAVHFFTANVALAEGSWKYDSRVIPLLFLMRKEGDVWKIASLRILNKSP